MKRILSLVLVAVMLFTLICINVSATEINSVVIKGHAIRYPEDATDEVIHIATLVASVFEGWKWTGYDKNARTTDATVSEDEILVGDCNRDEVQTAIQRLGVEKIGADGWVFVIIGRWLLE